MTLDQYLNSPGALTVAQLRAAIGVKSDAQIRQWRYGYAGRQPCPAYCAAIERATLGAVVCEDLRPDLAWTRIKDRTWPGRLGRPLHDVSLDPAEVG